MLETWLREGGVHRLITFFDSSGNLYRIITLHKQLPGNISDKYTRPVILETCLRGGSGFDSPP